MKSDPSQLRKCCNAADRKGCTMSTTGSAMASLAHKVSISRWEKMGKAATSEVVTCIWFWWQKGMPFQHDIFYNRIPWNTLDSLNDANTNLNKPHQLDDNSNEFWHFFEHQNFKTYAIQPTFDATLPSQCTSSCLVVWTLISRIPLGNVIHINESSIRMPYEKHHHPSYHKPRHHIMDKTMALFPDIVRYTLNQTCSKFQQLCFLVDMLISCDSVLNVTDWPGFTANVRMHKHTPVAYLFVACSFQSLDAPLFCVPHLECCAMEGMTWTSFQVCVRCRKHVLTAPA